MMTIFKMIVLIAAGAIGGILVERVRSKDSSTGPVTTPIRAVKDQRDELTALGSIQPQGGVREVALPPGMRPIRFDKTLVLNGHVDQGQTLAYLEGYDERLREIKVIVSEIEAAKKARDAENENEAMALEEIDREQIQACRLGTMQLACMDLKIKCLEEKWQLAQRQFEDVEGLQYNNTIPRQQYHQLRVQAEISLEEVRYAQAERERAKAELELNTGKAKIEQQKKRVKVSAERARCQISIEPLEHKLELSNEMLKRSTIVAPIQGTILEINTHPGETGNGQPLLKLGDISQLYVLADVYEDDGYLVQKDQSVKVTGRGLPIPPGGELQGVVVETSSMVGGHKQTPLDPTSRENARVFATWIKLNDKTPEDRDYLKQLQKFILLPVNVAINVSAGRSTEAAIANRP